MTTVEDPATTADLPATGRGTGLTEQTIEDVRRFHGHMCPGLAMGLRAAEVALQEVGPHSTDEEVVALVETDMCAVDAVQYLTGCTFGKGNLIHLDHGKNAYTFIRRSDGKAVRVATKPNAFGTSAEQSELFDKVRGGTATDEERGRFQEFHLARSRAILDAPASELYDVREVRGAQIPPRARVVRSVVCVQCQEPTMETRIRLYGGRELCPACFAAVIAS